MRSWHMILLVIWKDSIGQRWKNGSVFVRIQFYCITIQNSHTNLISWKAYTVWPLVPTVWNIRTYQLLCLKNYTTYIKLYKIVQKYTQIFLTQQFVGSHVHRVVSFLNSGVTVYKCARNMSAHYAQQAWDKLYPTLRITSGRFH